MSQQFLPRSLRLLGLSKNPGHQRQVPAPCSLAPMAGLSDPEVASFLHYLQKRNLTDTLAAFVKEANLAQEALEAIPTEPVVATGGASKKRKQSAAGVSNVGDASKVEIVNNGVVGDISALNGGGKAVLKKKVKKDKGDVHAVEPLGKIEESVPALGSVGVQSGEEEVEHVGNVVSGRVQKKGKRAAGEVAKEKEELAAVKSEEIEDVAESGKGKVDVAPVQDVSKSKRKSKGEKSRGAPDSSGSKQVEALLGTGEADEDKSAQVPESWPRTRLRGKAIKKLKEAAEEVKCDAAVFGNGTAAAREEDAKTSSAEEPKIEEVAVVVDKVEKKGVKEKKSKKAKVSQKDAIMADVVSEMAVGADAEDAKPIPSGEEAAKETPVEEKPQEAAGDFPVPSKKKSKKGKDTGKKAAVKEAASTTKTQEATPVPPPSKADEPVNGAENGGKKKRKRDEDDVRPDDQNGSLPEDQEQGGLAKKAKRADHQSTTGRAFQRIDVSKVEILDPRLGDNSYWGKDGAENGWGAKAEVVLGKVRGKDFRHEKTKKKRGSYKGGAIDLSSHSVKFNYSDED